AIGDVEAAGERVANEELPLQRRRSPQAPEVAGQVAAGGAHAPGLAAVAHVPGEVPPTERQPLGGGGVGDALSSVEERADLAEDEGVFDRAAPDHDAGAAGLVEGSAGVVGALHVAVDDDGDVDHAARAGGPRP